LFLSFLSRSFEKTSKKCSKWSKKDEECVMIVKHQTKEHEMATNSLKNLSPEHQAQAEMLADIGVDIMAFAPVGGDIGAVLDELAKAAVTAGMTEETETTKVLDTVCRIVEEAQLPLGVWGKKFTGYRVGYEVTNERDVEFAIMFTNGHDNPDTPYLRSWIQGAQFSDAKSSRGFMTRITDSLMSVYRFACCEALHVQEDALDAYRNQPTQPLLMEGFFTSLFVAERDDYPYVRGYRYPTKQIAPNET
jgi:hypothetical protein